MILSFFLTYIILFLEKKQDDKDSFGFIFIISHDIYMLIRCYILIYRHSHRHDFCIKRELRNLSIDETHRSCLLCSTR
jgi:hypothetical protein